MERLAAKTHLLGRTLYNVALPFWHLRRHVPSRVRAVIINEKQQILLVKNWFGPGEWELPGGAMLSFETPKQALVRELQEELRLTTSEEALRPTGILSYRKPLASYDAFCFTIKLKQPQFRLTGEVYKVMWVNRQEVTKYQKNLAQQLTLFEQS
jgi:8-oxo-dGTP pyrophosphatase MutT (NUDIX family)